MKRITAEDPLSQSADIVGDNIEQLKQLFPSVFTEGKIDFKALRDILGDEVETDPEYYRFTWPGKQKAKAEARKPSRGTLRPAPEESVDWNTTQNLYIEGDNLEVLKLLQKSYAGKVKMIYIDPPYNTGKDFVYKDNYKDNLANYNEQFNRYDEDGNLKSSAAETNQEGHARYHSNWLNMMYPRLTLARNLLTEDGVIFISIDDNELDNLKKIGNEIFGEENFQGFIARETGTPTGGGNLSIVNKVDYILLFSKSGSIDILGLPLTESEKRIYDKENEFGKYLIRPLRRTGGEDRKEDRPSMYFGLKAPDGQVVYPIGPTGYESRWICGKEKAKELDENHLLEWIENDGIWTVYQRYYLDGRLKQPSNLWSDIEGNKKATRDIRKLFNNKKVFDFPKPVGLLKRMIQMIDCKEDIILDFFSGAATTAHAVIELNAKDDGNRKLIQVQLPEPTDPKSEAFKAGYETIAEIGKERIRRACKKILEENPELKGKLDIGFKVFKLDESNIKTWETDPEKLEQNLLVEDVIKDDRSEQDVVYEILLKYGLDLTLPIQIKEKNGQTLYAIGGGALLVCLSDNLTPATAQAILDWKEELGAENPKVVFKESGFKNSQDKVNALQLLKSNEVKDVWSI